MKYFFDKHFWFYIGFVINFIDLDILIDTSDYLTFCSRPVRNKYAQQEFSWFFSLSK